MKGESCHVLQSCSGDVPDEMSRIGLKKCHACHNTVFNIVFIWSGKNSDQLRFFFTTDWFAEWFLVRNKTDSSEFKTQCQFSSQCWSIENCYGVRPTIAKYGQKIKNLLLLIRYRRYRLDWWKLMIIDLALRIE